MSSTQQLLLGEGAGGAAPVYIEDVFSTWLYTGTGAALTITNNIDLSTKSGMVWIKSRNGSAKNHQLTDTVRGVTQALKSNSTAAQTTEATGLTAFSSTGFTIGSGSDYNTNAETYVSWTLREQPKFFDVVTYTGNGTAGTTISHSLGSTPGCIMVKKTSGADAWAVYHRGVNSDTGDGLLVLNTTGAQNVNGKFWWGDNTNYIAPTSTNFTVSNDGQVNASGATYVAYLFAHNAGGFGLTGTDNVISCGSYTGNSGSQTITLGYEPQWLLVKAASGTFASSGEWLLIDTMRGASYSSNVLRLKANSADPEAAESGAFVKPVATGFGLETGASTNINRTGITYIYIAIRRGPMKVPTSGTSVFAPFSNTTVSPRTLTTNFVSDLAIQGYVNTTAFDGNISSRLQNANYMRTTSTTDEYTGYQFFNWASNTALISNDGNATKKAIYAFSRAPSYLDVVCYTGTGANRTISHNLAAVPELMIVKQRGGVSGWLVYAAGMGNTKAMRLNSTQAEEVGSDFWNNTTPTSTVFSLGNNGDVNQNTGTYINYLFATCAGVSKVGSYTGNGSTQTINCGFTSGARFVLIKRTDSTGDWYTYDTARGMTTVTDPYLLVNSQAAQVATLGSVTTVSTGFALDATILAAINTNAASYIFLAIA